MARCGWPSICIRQPISADVNPTCVPFASVACTPVTCPLLHLHLQKLEAAGLVRSQMELSDDGKALNYFEVTRFHVPLTPEAIAAAAPTLSTNPDA